MLTFGDPAAAGPVWRRCQIPGRDHPPSDRRLASNRALTRNDVESRALIDQMGRVPEKAAHRGDHCAARE